LPKVDADNTNAQSLNVREIALRLDPERFRITLLYEYEPDQRLLNRTSIRLLQLPARRKTFCILREMLSGHDIIAYVDFSPASYLLLHLPSVLRHNAKTVFHAEGPSAQIGNPSRTLRFLYFGILPRCDIYTAITPFMARDVQANIQKQPSYILPVGVDTNLFRPPSERNNSAPVVLFAGALIERKGPQYVIDAAARFPDATFRIVGRSRGGFDTVLQQRIAEMGLRNIKLEGPKSQAQLLEIMRTSDIFLLPSRLEGLPKVTLEAAATGLPCIVFRNYDTPSVLDEVTGFQVNTLEEMMNALRRLMADRTLRIRMGAAARKHVERFDWNVVSRDWQNTYLEIAASRPK
jgi:glycosyltransferase involved in cell wall biosynthesis